jgi:enoyl-CoA hydratase
MAFAASNIDAARAEQIGLVERVHDDVESLRKGAFKLAREIAANPPLTVQGTKQVLNYSADRPIEDGLRYVAAWNTAQIPSEDMREVLRSFAERRTPKFTGD